MIKEFKKFIERGNVMELAVGVIMGASFGKIVSSLVDNIIMPVVGAIIGGINFTGLVLTFKDVTVNYGIFIQNVIDFIIIAFFIFLMVKLTNKLLGKKDEKKKAAEVALLEEIRDALVNKEKSKKQEKKKLK